MALINYLDHSNIFWFHSWISPINKIIINIIFNINHCQGKEIFIIEIDGIIKAISTSKIKKIIVIRKKCNENGKREEDFWSNPHSKAEIFSRSKLFFLEIIIHNIIIIFAIIKMIKNDISIVKINYYIII